MRQIMLDMSAGLTEALEAPMPSTQAGLFLIQKTRSLISERTGCVSTLFLQTKQ